MAEKALVKSIYKASTHPSPQNFTSTCFYYCSIIFLILFHHLCWFHFQPDLSLCEKHNNPFFVFLSHLSMAALKRAHWSIRGYSVHLLWRRPFKCSQESFSERLGEPFCLRMIWYICWTIQGALLWIFLPQLACKHVSVWFLTFFQVNSSKCSSRIGHLSIGIFILERQFLKGSLNPTSN